MTLLPRLAPAALLALGLAACSVDVPSLDLPPVPEDAAGDPGPVDDEGGADAARDEGPADVAGDAGAEDWGPWEDVLEDPGADPGVDTTSYDNGPEAGGDTGLDAGTDLGTDPGTDPGTDTTCIPYCDGAACGNDDGCGMPCGCNPGYECATDLLACVFTDWAAAYRGTFRVFATAQMFPLPDQEVVCEGSLAVQVIPGNQPPVKGDGQCTVSAGTTRMPFYVQLEGEIVGREGVQGVATYGSDSGYLGQSGFSAAFSGPAPRVLTGSLDGGVQYDSGLTKVYFRGGDFQVVEAR